MQHILAADIGGTNSRFAWFEAAENGLTFKDGLWLKTKGASSFKELLSQLEESDFGIKPSTCDLAVMAVPGAVQNGSYAKPPNIDWDIDASRVSSLFSRTEAMLINDFVAQAFATRTDAVGHAEEVKSGTPDPKGAVAAIGAGTGLGHCVLKPDGYGGYVALPAEAGHVAFAFNGSRELAYQDFLIRETGLPYPIGDVVVSGKGLSLVHRFLTGEDLTPEEVSKKLDNASETLEWFARFYGRACRHYALCVLSLGGVFIAGGVAAKNPALVRHPAFEQEFVNSPSYGHLLEEIPIRLNANEESGLWGAALYGILKSGRQHMA